MSDLSVRDRVRASVIQEALRVELLPLYIKKTPGRVVQASEVRCLGHVRLRGESTCWRDHISWLENGRGAGEGGCGEEGVAISA